MAEVFALYREIHVDAWDIERLVGYLKDVVPSFLMAGEIFSPEMWVNYLDVLNTLMDDDLRMYFEMAISWYEIGDR